MRFPGSKYAQKYICDCGSAPNPAGGAYSAPLEPLAGFAGHFTQGGKELVGEEGAPEAAYSQ